MNARTLYRKRYKIMINAFVFQDALQGFLLGGSLIVAIGAQNAFILRQGITKDRVVFVASLCLLGDIFLISLGVSGAGRFIASSPLATQIATYGGALYLLWFGYNSFKAARRPQSLDVTAAEHTDTSFEKRRNTPLRQLIIMTAAVTLLNPHAYLDAVIILGGVSSGLSHNGATLFAIGAMCASAIWFMSLAFISQKLAPIFKKPATWKVLNIGIGSIMCAIALSLLLDTLQIS
jgi:L-lysine exporter family protein LysE/ArgO